MLPTNCYGLPRITASIHFRRRAGEIQAALWPAENHGFDTLNWANNVASFLLWPAENHGFDTLCSTVRRARSGLWPAENHGFDTLNWANNVASYLLWPAENHGFDTLPDMPGGSGELLWPAENHGFDTLRTIRRALKQSYGLPRITASIHLKCKISGTDWCYGLPRITASIHLVDGPGPLFHGYGLPRITASIHSQYAQVGRKNGYGLPRITASIHSVDEFRVFPRAMACRESRLRYTRWRRSCTRRSAMACRESRLRYTVDGCRPDGNVLWPAENHGFDTLAAALDQATLGYGLPRITASIHCDFRCFPDFARYGLPRITASIHSWAANLLL